MSLRLKIWSCPNAPRRFYRFLEVPADIPGYPVSLCRHMCSSMIHGTVHAVCTFLILAEYRLRPFSSSWLARRALLIAHKKIRGVFSRTICCFPWCRLSFSALPFLGDETCRERMLRRNLLVVIYVIRFYCRTMKPF